jgi:hypothetical protein
MGLSIRTTPAQIDIDIIHAKLEWKTKNAELRLHQKPPEIDIKTEQPLLKIDQYQCFAECGLKNNYDFIKGQAQNGYQNLLQYIAKVAQNGDAMAQVGNQASIMLNIIRSDYMNTHEFGLGMMPKSSPKVQLTGGTIEIKAAPRNGIGEINGVTGEYTDGDVNFKYTPGDVKIRMLSYGSVDIKYTGSNVDSYV